jgi:hypothetical protein
MPGPASAGRRPGACRQDMKGRARPEREPSPGPFGLRAPPGLPADVYWAFAGNEGQRAGRRRPAGGKAKSRRPGPRNGSGPLSAGQGWEGGEKPGDVRRSGG